MKAIQFQDFRNYNTERNTAKQEESLKQSDKAKERTKMIAYLRGE